MPELRIKWKVRGRDDLQDDEIIGYPVTRIERIRFRKGKREFLVKWTRRGTIDYEPTWEPEDNLSTCFDLLQDFLMKEQLPLSTIEPRYGSSSFSKLHITENWITMSKVMKTVNGLLKYQKIVPACRVNPFSALDSEGGVHILPLEAHLYAIAHKPLENMIYIADGNNEYINRHDVRKKIRKILKGVKITAIEFNQQYRSDACGSSVALIVCEMVKYYKTNDWPEKITVSAKLRTKTTKTVHTKSLEQSEFIKQTDIDMICQHCGKHFGTRSSKKLNKRAFNMHTVVCKNKESK